MKNSLAKPSDKNRPLVGLIMGSQSDFPVMQKATEILTKFKIPWELKIVSAHRTPQKMYEYAHTAYARGLKVIIAGAGGAAHLPGMVASITTLPVIGVPIETKYLKGLDSLLSIVQMPRGIPVATVAINNAENAGILAARILGVSELGQSQLKLPQKLNQFEKKLEKQVLKMNQSVVKILRGK